MCEAPYVGMPATIHLQTDSVPAVVIRVNRKSVTVRSVEVDDASRERVNDPREPQPCYVWQGITSKPIGQPERYALMPNGNYRNGSIGLSLGRAVRVVDYRH